MTVTETTQAVPKVFISYTQESIEHSRRVLNLSNDLRGIGFESDIDQYHSNQRWPTWMEERIAWADFVLVICTKTYLCRWNNEEKPGVGLGAQWESLLARQYLYESPRQNNKFIPVVFETLDLSFIPKPLADVTRVHVGPNLEHLERLRSRLLGIAPAEMPPIRTSLSPIAVASGFFQQTEHVNELQFEPRQLGLHSESENLVPNLFPVTFPQTIYSAKIGIKRGSRTEFENRLKIACEKHCFQGAVPIDVFVDSGVVYTFRNFEAPFWKELFANKTLVNPDQFKTSKWAESAATEGKNNFRKLLSRCLHHLCENNGTSYRISYSKDMKCYLFAAKKNAREGKLKSLAIKQIAERTVYKVIKDNSSTDPEAIQHWQHEAFRYRFVTFGSNWYLVLTPFWAFTCDGVSGSSKWQKKASSNMRKPERNRAVLGHVLFWANVLCKEPDLFESRDVFRVQRPVDIRLDPSIQDADWMNVAKDEEQQTVKTDMEVLL